MKRTNRTLAFSVSTTLGILLLTGCATEQPTGIGQTTGINQATSNQSSNDTTGSANNTTTNTSTNNTTIANGQGTSSFPYIVKQAMQALPQDVLADAQSPTVLPMPQNGDALSFATTQSTTPSSSAPTYTATYTVNLKSSSGKVGSWSVWGFGSSSDAKKALPSLSGKSPSASGNGQAIVLTGNENAQVIHDKNGSTDIEWKQSNWNIRVTQSQTEVAPTPIADEVAKYLAKTPMHPPGQTGTIYIDTTEGTDSTVDAHVVWQNGRTVDEVEVTGLAVTPVTTVLAMAGSMETYGTASN